jgi:hypothetical protein
LTGSFPRKKDIVNPKPEQMKGRSLSVLRLAL